MEQDAERNSGGSCVLLGQDAAVYLQESQALKTCIFLQKATKHVVSTSFNEASDIVTSCANSTAVPDASSYDGQKVMLLERLVADLMTISNPTPPPCIVHLT